MKKIFLVYHTFDLWNGDVPNNKIPWEEIVAAFESEAMAKEFIARHTNEHVYFGTNTGVHLMCGNLIYRAFYVDESVSDATKGLRNYADEENNWFFNNCDLTKACGPIFKNLEV